METEEDRGTEFITAASDLVSVILLHSHVITILLLLLFILCRTGGKSFIFTGLAEIRVKGLENIRNFLRTN